MNAWHGSILFLLGGLILIACMLAKYLFIEVVIPWIDRFICEHWEAIQELFTGRVIDTTPMVNKIIEESIVKVSPAAKYEDVYPVPMPVCVMRRGEVIDDNMLEVF